MVVITVKREESPKIALHLAKLNDACIKWQAQMANLEECPEIAIEFCQKIRTWKEWSRKQI